MLLNLLTPVLFVASAQLAMANPFVARQLAPFDISPFSSACQSQCEPLATKTQACVSDTSEDPLTCYCSSDVSSALTTCMNCASSLAQIPAATLQAVTDGYQSACGELAGGPAVSSPPGSASNSPPSSSSGSSAPAPSGSGGSTSPASVKNAAESRNVGGMLVTAAFGIVAAGLLN